MDKEQKCDWDGEYGKDELDNLFFWCIYCNKKRGLEELGKVKCTTPDK